VQDFHISHSVTDIYDCIHLECSKGAIVIHGTWLRLDFKILTFDSWGVETIVTRVRSTEPFFGHNYSMKTGRF